MTTFRIVLHRLRKRYIGKQLALATSLGCTEAAISLWEHGRRLPSRSLLPRIVECFRASGARTSEIEELQGAYERRRRKHAGANHFRQLSKLDLTTTSTEEGNSRNGKFHSSR